LAAQIVDTAGANIGGEVTTGFAEIGAGAYLWTYAAMPDAQRGGVKFYQSGVPGTILAFAAVNPEEAENTDAKVSTKAAPGDLMGLADDAITAAKYDESTAFPLKSADTGATQVARVGADGDTLETLSDQIDLQALEATLTAMKGAGWSDETLKALGDLLDAILLDTGTDGVALSTAVKQAIADEVLKRGASNVQDTADAHSLTTLILAAFESAISGTTWTIKKTDGTTFTTKTVITDAAANPITAVT